MHPFHTIVVAVDFSDTSPDTFGAALELARRDQQRLHLVHVVQDVLRTGGTVEMPTVDWPEVQRGWTEDARRQMVQLAALCNLDPQTVTITVTVGQPAADEVKAASGIEWWKRTAALRRSPGAATGTFPRLLLNSAHSASRPLPPQGDSSTSRRGTDAALDPSQEDV